MTSYLRAALVVAGITVAEILLTFAAHADTSAPGCMSWDAVREKGWKPAPDSVANPPAIPPVPEPKPPSPWGDQLRNLAKPALPQMYTVPGLWGPHYLLRTSID